MMLPFKKLSLVALAAVVTLPVLAVPTLRLTDGGGATFDVTDELAGDTLPGLVGAVSWSGLWNNWLITVDSGLTKPILGTSLLPIMNLNTTVQRMTNSAGTITFEFSETGFTADPFQANFTGSVSSAASSGSAEILSLIDVPGTPALNPGNALFAGSTYVSSGALPWNGSTNTNVSSTGGSLSPLTPYSLTLRSVINLEAGAAGRQVNATASLAAVPEPGFYGALALGLSGLFAAVARRRKSSNV